MRFLGKTTSLGIVFVVASTAAWLVSDMASAQSADHNFVGVEACGRCHRMANSGDQLGQWQSTAHSGAFETLASDEAATVAAAAGVDNAQEAEECLRCHTTGAGLTDENFEEGFDPTQGVQCESCHGAGADYAPMAVMRDHEQAVANGLVVPDEALCQTCHNAESPTFTEFDFAARYSEIQHAIPE